MSSRMKWYPLEGRTGGMGGEEGKEGVVSRRKGETWWSRWGEGGKKVRGRGTGNMVGMVDMGGMAQSEHCLSGRGGGQ